VSVRIARVYPTAGERASAAALASALVDRSRPLSGGFDDGNLAPQGAAELTHHLQDPPDTSFPALIEKCEYHQAGQANALSHDQFAEVIVLGNEDAAEPPSSRCEIDILGASGAFQCIDDVMPSASDRSDDSLWAAFIGEEIHLLGGN
jgi:hypothetical protein